MARLLAAAAALALALGTATTGAAGGTIQPIGDPDESHPLRWMVDPDGEGPIEVGDDVDQSSAAIWRDEDGITFRIETTGLTEGHGYTVWFFSYDFPERCMYPDEQAGRRCTGFDLATPGVFGSFMWGRAGAFVEGSGLTTFIGRRPKNSTPCVTEPVVLHEDCAGVMLGHGLHNPMGSEIHFVLRDHGPDQPDVPDETTTINGGCDPATHHGLPVFGPGWGTPGNYACFDPQGNN